MHDTFESSEDTCRHCGEWEETLVDAQGNSLSVCGPCYDQHGLAA